MMRICIAFNNIYRQIQMEEDSKELAAFETPLGCYQFKSMTFGLVNSAVRFNRMMRKMFPQVKNIKHYMDNVLVHTAVWTDHLATLRELFTTIRKAGLTIRLSMCCLGYSSLDYVGHKVGSN